MSNRKAMNHHGDMLTEKYYILPDEDSLALPLIKTPCYLTNRHEIDLTFSTQEDAKVKECPQCGCSVIFATLTPGKMDVSHWVCMCGHRWDTHRGIFYQMELFNNDQEKRHE